MEALPAASSALICAPPSFLEHPCPSLSWPRFNPRCFLLWISGHQGGPSHGPAELHHPLLLQKTPLSPAPRTRQPPSGSLLHPLIPEGSQGQRQLEVRVCGRQARLRGSTHSLCRAWRVPVTHGQSPFSSLGHTEHGWEMVQQRPRGGPSPGRRVPGLAAWGGAAPVGPWRASSVPVPPRHMPPRSPGPRVRRVTTACLHRLRSEVFEPLLPGPWLTDPCARNKYAGLCSLGRDSSPSRTLLDWIFVSLIWQLPDHTEGVRHPGLHTSWGAMAAPLSVCFGCNGESTCPGTRQQLQVAAPDLLVGTERSLALTPHRH
ncbi:uncharacterized protein LOC108311211 [Cebus imitator]|uniref:uncharacterized protein LOC108311211 n=1 Tax=Cebus imitator TaxID=2715852 RepID=UPI000809C6D3|nr:uncharacterized protein LOC108311211 [Cebus imitator]